MFYSTAGFKGRTTDWYKSKQLQQTNRGSSRWQDLPSSSKEKTSQIALNLLTVTDKFTFFIHSLLAGLAIWQVGGWLLCGLLLCGWLLRD